MSPSRVGSVVALVALVARVSIVSLVEVAALVVEVALKVPAPGSVCLAAMDRGHRLEPSGQDSLGVGAVDGLVEPGHRLRNCVKRLHVLELLGTEADGVRAVTGQQ